MTGTPSHARAELQPAIVAGHICLDIIPALPPDPGRRALLPGSLDSIGPVTLAPGGCVGNTGIALSRLGVATHLVARVGDDALGRVLVDLVRGSVPPGAARLAVTPGQATSYSVVLNRPGEDRAIGHFPGVNDTFVAGDVPSDLLRDAAWLHVGYPPLMATLAASDGAELARLLVAAHRHGVATSLDMANANLDTAEDGVRWRELLARALPDVDVFLPSLDEACLLLGRRIDRDEQGSPSPASVGDLADELLDQGVAIAGLKLGEHGLYVRTAAQARIAAMPRPPAAAWADRELYSPVFEADVVGTTGAGDTTIAGFLYGLLAGMGPEDAVTAACAVGGSSTEAPDGTSGVPAWAEVERRLAGGWRRRPADPGSGWTRPTADGPWHGPRDRGRVSPARRRPRSAR